MSRPLAVLLATASLALAGCTPPAVRIDQRAADLAFVRELIDGAPFRHLIYHRQGDDGDTLRVYIEHDGTPWLFGGRVSDDPTPRKPVMLELMALDPGPVLYLGRPCYFGTARMPPCSPLWWTHRRYGEAVVDSMAAALRRFLATHPYRHLAFFGHSGGGTLAVLLAERFAETRVVITLAGNLDVDEWARLHRYTPLYGSLDPIDRPSLSSSVVQRHYVGAADDNVPSRLVRRYAERHAGAEWLELPGVDHACCWQRYWPDILLSLQPPTPP